MSISDEQFANWLKQDNANRVVLVEIDYKAESGGAPVTNTVRIADQTYFDDDAVVVYDEVLRAAPQFARALSGERLGNYQSTLGTVEVNNADGRYDSLLTRALDGNEVRAYLGDGSWARTDFRLVFSALATRAVAPSDDRISVQLRDAALLLNKSIAGTSTVGGTGPHKDKLRPVNFGYVHQVECLLYDQATLTFVHSDSGANTLVVAVRDRGIDIAFTDNGDGTITLPVAPDGAISADVLVVLSTDLGDLTHRRLSHAFMALVGERAGFVAAGKYLGANVTFTENDDDDYLVGISLPEARNIVELLNALVDTGNCFWAMTREGMFTYGRLNPDNVEALLGSPITVVEIENDDIDHGTLRVEHASTKYYKLQAYMSKNWSEQTDLAFALTPEERALRMRKGLYYAQPDTTGTTYAEAPQLYSKSLEVSPPIETYLSAGFDEEELPVIERWALRRKLMLQPWVEIISCTVGIEFYTLELGDVVQLTLDRFGTLAAATDYFADTFSGTGDFSTHVPDTGGGAYQSDGGPITDLLLDGAGFAYGTDSGSYAYSTFDGAPASSFTFTLEVLLEAGDVGNATYIDTALLSGGPSGDWVLNPYLHYDTTNNNFLFSAFDSVGVDDQNLALALGAHTIRIEVSSDSTLWYVDDTLLFTRAPVDTSSLDAVEIGLSNEAGSTALKLSSVRVSAAASSGAANTTTSLLQVVGVDIRLTEGKVGLQLMRRRASGEIPDDFSPAFSEDDEIETGLLVPILPPPEPPLPPNVPPGPAGGPGSGTSGPGSVDISGAPAGPFVDRVQTPSSFADYVTGTAGKAYAYPSISTVALTHDAGYMVVGNPIDESGGGDTLKNGIVFVYKRASDGSYSLVHTITRPTGGGASDTATGWGSIVDINANLDIVVGTIQPGGSPGSPFTGNNLRVFESTGTDTWDTGTDLGVSGVLFAKFAKWPAAASWSTVRILVVGYTWSGTAQVTNSDRVHVWRNSGSSWDDTDTLTPDTQSDSLPPQHLPGAAITFDGRYIAIYYSTNNSKSWVELWRTNDSIDWDSDQSFQVGEGDGAGGSDLDRDQGNDIAISGDGRVIIAVNTTGIYRGSDFYEGAYVFRAPGTALWPVLGAYKKTALLVGEANTFEGMGAVALSFDGQFAVVGLASRDEGDINAGAVFGVNRIQSRGGEHEFVQETTLMFKFSNPFPNDSYLWGSAVAMDFNGRTVAVQIGNGYVGTPPTLVRVFDNKLDDHIAGITNDDWQNAYDFTPGIFVQNARLPAVKIGAANMEPGETLSSGGNVAQSLWYKLSPSVDVSFSIDTLLSTEPLDPFYPDGYPQTTRIDTTIGIYIGANVDTLTEVAFNNDSGTGGVTNDLSRLTAVALSAGETYYIRIQPAALAGVDFPLLRIRYSYQAA